MGHLHSPTPDDVPLVLDIHPLAYPGEYISPTDDRFARIIDSWRGVRPVIHYSVSREDILIGHPTNVQPDMDILLAGEYKKAKLRAHSDYMWNNAVNDWALEFLQYADIMVESKAKNLASVALHKYYTENKNELSKQNVRQKASSEQPIFTPLW